MKYFLHDTNAIDDEKVTELFMQYGYEGVGLFYVVLEKLAKQEKPVKTSVLKAQLKVGKRLNKCWDFMEEIGLISSNNGETFNKQLLNFSEKYQIKKEKTRKKVSEWRERQDNTETVTGYKNIRNHPKVKLSKVNIIKENKEKKLANKSPDFIDQIVNVFVEQHGSYEIMNNGQERTAAAKVLALYKKKYPSANSEEILSSLKIFFNQCVNINDEWLRTNMSLSTIVSKINSITKILSNGKSNNKKNGATIEGIANAIAKNFATDFESTDEKYTEAESSVPNITRRIL